jgi:hypothetical protein
MNEIQKRLVRLFDEANEKTEASMFATDAEPYMAAFVDEVRRNPAERPFVVGIFERALDTPAVTWEFLTFCFHSLRWPEVKNLVLTRLERDKDNPRTRSTWADLRDSFDDDWWDADLFKAFSLPPES